MLRIALVDDDAEDLRLLKENIEKYFAESPGECAILTFAEGEDLLMDYDSSYDVIFLDVEMRWSNGIDVARRIRELDENTVIIFISRVAQYALQGYSVDAMDYILKPLEYADLEKKLRKAINHVQSRRGHKLQIAMDGDYRWLSSESIRYVEVFGHSLVYHTSEGDFHASGSIASVSEELEKYHFIRCTRFLLVNLKYVTGIDGNNIILGEDRLPISRRRRAEIVSALLIYNGGRA